MQHSIRSDTPSENHTPHRLPRPRHEPGREKDRPERAVVVSVLLPDTRADLRDPLGELTALAKSAGVEVVDQLIQKRTHLSAGSALGKGKLAELVERAGAHEADVIIFDNDLSPRQIRTLEKELSLKIIDRSELILDIFASRAKTREAQLEVELAQLQYTAPRLRGMWTHLERIAGAAGATAAGGVGGVGTRGPGERQIEIDRRIVKDRIAYLKRQINEITKRKEREVKARADQFTVSLVGYTNSGKSTLMNKLTGAGRYAADQLFATLDTKTVRWDLGDGRTALLSDTVGFVRDIPHHLVASFTATLEEAIHADLLLHVVDVSAPTAWQQMESVEGVLDDLGCHELPRITVLNKIDAGDHGTLAEMLARHRACSLQVSALTGEGLDSLVQEVVRRMQGHAAEVTVRLPHSAGKVAAELDRVADVRNRRYLEDGVELDLRINRSQLAQLVGRHPELVITAGSLEPEDDLPFE